MTTHLTREAVERGDHTIEQILATIDALADAERQRAIDKQAMTVACAENERLEKRLAAVEAALVAAEARADAWQNDYAAEQTERIVAEHRLDMASDRTHTTAQVVASEDAYAAELRADLSQMTAQRDAADARAERAVARCAVLRGELERMWTVALGKVRPRELDALQAVLATPDTAADERDARLRRAALEEAAMLVEEADDGVPLQRMADVIRTTPPPSTEEKTR